MRRSHYGYQSAYSGPYGGAYDGERTASWTPLELDDLRAWYDAELGQPKYHGRVELAGTSGDYITAPLTTPMAFSNDIEVVMRVKCTDWSAAANQTLAGRYVTTGNQRSWRFYTSTTGTIGLTASNNGTAVTSVLVTPTNPLPDDTWIWLRMRLDLSNGANSVATLETAADTGDNTEPTSWTANGTNTGAIISGVFAGTAGMEIGTFAGGTLERFTGAIGRCIVRNGFDGYVTSDFNASDCYGPGYTSSPTLPVDSGGSKYVPLSGLVGDYIYAPDAAPLRITGDIEFVVRVSLDDWTPAATQRVISRFDGGTNRCYSLLISSSGLIYIETTVDGTTGTAASGNSTVAVGAMDGTTIWLKATLDVDDGAGNRVYNFYTAPDQATEPTTWTQLGSTVTTAGTTSIFAGTRPLEIGSRTSGNTERLDGNIYRAIVRNGIGGTTVADFNAETASVSYDHDAYNNLWTINWPKHRGIWTLGLPKIYDASPNAHPPAVFGAGSNQPLWLPWDGTSGVYIPRDTTTFVGPARSVSAYNTGGAVDIVYDVELTPITTGVYAGTGRLSAADTFIAYLNANNTLRFRVHDGTTSRTYDSTVAVPGWQPGVRRALRYSADIDNGAGGTTVTFYTAATIDGPWVQLGDPVTQASLLTVRADTAPVAIGPGDSGTRGAVEAIYHRARVTHDGVVKVLFNASECGQNGYTEPTTSSTWLMNRGTTGRKPSPLSAPARTARSQIVLGSDDWIDVPAAAIPALDTQAAASSASAACRRWHNPGGNVIFATKANSTITTLGLSTRNATAGTSVVIGTQVGDGVTSDSTVGVSSPFGERTVVTAVIGDPAVRDYINGAPLASDGVRTTTTTTSTGGAGRIGAYTGGTGAIDMEFEGLTLVDAVVSDVDHGRLVAYYGGGL